MKIPFIVLLLIGFCSTFCLGQKEHLSPCGTPSFKSQWLKEYQKDPSKYKTRSGGIMYIPMTVHVLTGSATDDFIFDNLCQLNTDFAGTDLQFYLNHPIRRVSNGNYNNHTELEVGYNMMVEYNVENTINTYVVDNPAGNCGYNLPYAGIAMNRACMGEGDHTWAHEVGHNLSIQHPFLGWEGGVSYNGTVPHSFADPAPEWVTYDYTAFKLEPYFDFDTLIIDTAFVEKADGSNCHFAADGFCDTDPDYIASGWSCDQNSGNESFMVFTDPDGVKLKADGTLIMSYANDVCSARFTDEQSAAMRANLLDEKSDYLDPDYLPLPMLDPEVILNYPIDDEVVYHEFVQLDWEDIENADFYKVEVLITNEVFPGMTFPWMSFSTAESEITIPAMDVNIQFFWSVTPYTDFEFCNANATVMQSFITSDVSSTEELTDAQVKLFPNVLKQGQDIQIELEAMKAITISIRSIDGKSVFTHEGLESKLRISTQAWTPGIYLAHMQLKEGRTTKKIILY